MKKRKWIWIGLAVILIAGVLMVSNPQIRTNLFVRLYHDDIEEGYLCLDRLSMRSVPLHMEPFS